MKKLIIYFIILIIIISTLLSICPIYAEVNLSIGESGYLNDILYDVKFIGPNESFQVSGHEDIDIKQIQHYELIDNQSIIQSIILETSVVGKINISNKVEYKSYIYFVDKYSDEKYYQIEYLNGSCFGNFINEEPKHKDILNATILFPNKLKISVPIIKLSNASGFSLFKHEHFIFVETYKYEENGSYYMDFCKPWLWNDWIVITEPFDGSTVFGNCIIKGITNNPRYKSIEFVEIQISPESSNCWKKTFTFNNWTNWSYQWNTENIADGRYIIKVRTYNGLDYYYDRITLYVNQQMALNVKTTEIPVYHIGDRYKYKNEFYYGFKDDLNIMLNVIKGFSALEKEITGLDTILINGTTYDVYVSEKKEEYKGYDYVSKIRFTSWIRRSDLATIKEEFELNGTDKNGKSFHQDLWVITYEYPNGYIYYPLKVGNKWENTIIKKIVRYIYTPEDGTEIYHFTIKGKVKNECLRTDTITVPAGTFEVFIISSYYYDFENEYYERNFYEKGQINTSELGWYFGGYFLEYYSPEIANTIKVEEYCVVGDKRESVDSSELIFCKYGNKTYKPTSNTNFDIQTVRIFIGISIITICSMIFITSTEVGKYGFFSTVIPLYAKHKRKKNYEHGFIKGSVRGIIYGNPGENYSSIKRILNLPNGTLTYYLRVLEKERMIKSERDGLYKRFYPIGLEIKKVTYELSDIQKDIYIIIKENPGIYQKKILTFLDISQQKLNYHIQLMIKSNILEIERVGNKTKCFIKEIDIKTNPYQRM